MSCLAALVHICIPPLSHTWSLAYLPSDRLLSCATHPHLVRHLNILDIILVVGWNLFASFPAPGPAARRSVQLTCSSPRAPTRKYLAALFQLSWNLPPSYTSNSVWPMRTFHRSDSDDRLGRHPGAHCCSHCQGKSFVIHTGCRRALICDPMVYI